MALYYNLIMKSAQRIKYPNIVIRSTWDLKDKIEAKAKATGKKKSQFIREALEKAVK